MQGLISTRLTHYVMGDGSVRPFLIVFVHPAATPTQDDPIGQYDKGIVNGVLFRDGLNDMEAHKLVADAATQQTGRELHSQPLMVWMSNVRFDSTNQPGTWHFPQRENAPAPVQVQEPDFIGKIIDRVQDLLNDHTESIKKMLDEHGAEPVPELPVKLKTTPAYPEWSPDTFYRTSERVSYLDKNFVALKDSAGVVPGAEGSQDIWRELPVLPWWSPDDQYKVGDKVEYDFGGQVADWIAVKPSTGVVPGSPEGAGFWSPLTGALQAFTQNPPQ